MKIPLIPGTLIFPNIMPECISSIQIYSASVHDLYYWLVDGQRVGFLLLCTIIHWKEISLDQCSTQFLTNVNSRSTNKETPLTCKNWEANFRLQWVNKEFTYSP